MTKDDLMTIRIPRSIKRVIRRQAAREKRTMANQVIYLIELGLLKVAPEKHDEIASRAVSEDRP